MLIVPTCNERVPRRWITALYWGLPPLVCLVVYWHGLQSWFLGDDFLWLGIQDRIRAGSSFWYEVFQPTQHGTFRPLSERLFFLVFHWAFGLRALPYHVFFFATFFADLALLASVLRRLTGSRAVGFWAAVFWTVNPAMATAMTWSSAYMQILCGFFLLLAFHFLLRHIETGQWRYYVAQAGVFVAGFFVMETNAVYPLIALGYTVFFARKYLLRTLPLLLVSLVYGVLHLALAPNRTGGYYAPRIDWQLLATFWAYWRDAVWPPQAAVLLHLPRKLVSAGIPVMTLALGGFLLWETMRKRFLAAVLFSWFVLLLAPLLPLRQHFLYYYLTLSLMGLAAFGGYALWRGWTSGGPWRLAAAVLAAEFVLISVPTAWRLTHAQYQLTVEARDLVSQVATVSRNQPGKTILLAGVTDGLFQRVIIYNPFPLVGADRVYLVPEARTHITPVLNTNWEDSILPTLPTREDLDQRRFVVLAVDRHMQDITESWARTALSRPAAPPHRINVASQLAGALLGEGWYGSEETHRWMGKRAALRIGGPAREGAKLMLEGGCAPEQVRQGPLRLSVSANGVPLPAALVASCGGANFELEFNLPPGLAQKSWLEIVVEVDRVYRAPGDQRELGLAFGTFEVR
jgi:hypothetical protein